MQLHEYQAKEILKNNNVPIPEGQIASTSDDSKKISLSLGGKCVVKAQVHAGGRGKAGGIKIIKDKDELIKEAKAMFGKILITHQTGPFGKQVKRLYLEEGCNIKKEFYLSCLVDRKSSKIAFISRTSWRQKVC